jgi:hypothetical protein
MRKVVNLETGKILELEDLPIVERPIEEIEAEIRQYKLNEAKQYLQETGWIWEKYNRNVVVLKDITSEEFAVKYADIIARQEECRLLINELES